MSTEVFVPIFQNPRTATVHHLKRLNSSSKTGVTACGREERVHVVAWSLKKAVTCRTCLRSGEHIAHIKPSSTDSGTPFDGPSGTPSNEGDSGRLPS